MGNCMETCIIGQEEIDTKQEEHDDDQQKQEEDLEEDEKRKVMRIKVVLTREELEWLVFQLEEEEEDNAGGKSSCLKDVLAEIERSRSGKLTDNLRGKVVSWKPALESIMESPE